jgi:branched-chain amino acid transport system substrate-binding protein
MPAAQEFLRKYRARFGNEGPYSVYGYDSLNILMTAIQEAGTTDAAAVAKVIREKTFQTCLGPVEFDAKGDLKKTNYILWTVQDGNFVVVP